ncbi:MAG: leucine-rich repeat domain-containing protein [Lachnospiraceae bacterium]|nr:leucine-rich repeat domain-containing protein [Lachnospiraceae bacterium]
MKRTLRRSIGSLMLISALILALIPSEALNAVNYVDAFQMDNNTLAKYTGTASVVSVPDDVTAIGKEAFADDNIVTSVSIGANTDLIDEGAFLNCRNLVSVTTHERLKTIDNAAFAGCENLMSVNLGASVDTLGYGVFAGCDKLEKVNINRNNDNFVQKGGGIYDDKVGMLYGYLSGYKSTYYNMPDTVESISKFSFWNNNTLDTVSLSPKLKSIPAYAFANCRNLKAVNIPYSVTTIDAKAFENCTSLYSVIIPESVKEIAPSAFDGCTHLKIIANEGTAAYEFFKNYDNSDIKTIEYSNSSTVNKLIESEKVRSASEEEGQTEDSTYEGTEDENGLDYKESIKEVVPGIGLVDASTDPSNVEYIPPEDTLEIISEDDSLLAKTIVVGGRAVLFIDPNAGINTGMINRNNDSGDTVSGSDNVSKSVDKGTDAPDDVAGPVIYDPVKGGYLPKFTEVNGVIADHAYYASDKLAGYTFDSNIRRIGDFAFARSSLESIRIPDTVNEIGYGAFYHCDDLNEVVIPSSVKSIEAYAFDKTGYIEEFKAKGKGDYLIVGDGILLAYRGSNEEVTIPSDVKKIAPGAFRSHSEIKSLTIPGNVKEIGEDAFRDCSNLASLTLENGVEDIGDRAFMNCPVEGIVIPGSVRYIGLRCFDLTDSGLEDSAKVVGFMGSSLPVIKCGETSKRLDNDDYRKDSLYNVIYAVVNEGTDLAGSVLDENKPGFSGLILSLDKDRNGAETGTASVVKCNIFSDEVLSSIPDSFVYNGREYSVKDKDKAVLAKNRSDNSVGIEAYYNDMPSDDIEATVQGNGFGGKLKVKDSAETALLIGNAYRNVFSEDASDIKGYTIDLTDDTDTISFSMLGSESIRVSMPLPDDLLSSIVRVVALDDDGQLEEVESLIEGNKITLIMNEINNIGMFAVDQDSPGLSVRDGQVVRNFKKDESPDTADRSLELKYVFAFLLASSGLFLLLYRKRA